LLGGDALISSSVVTSFLEVVKCKNLKESQISFVTRSIRIIDILTVRDATDFDNNGGIQVIGERLVEEVHICEAHIASATETVVCYQQRAALMKSLLNFLKRAVADPKYTAHVRRIMECELLRSIIHFLQNLQYYGPTILHCGMFYFSLDLYQYYFSHYFDFFLYPPRTNAT
jgi:E3 ubiquitin-protein ligase HUWE1